MEGCFWRRWRDSPCAAAQNKTTLKPNESGFKVEKEKQHHRSIWCRLRQPMTLWCCFDVAEMEGFEPPGGVTLQLISSQPRYDHFDTSPCLLIRDKLLRGNHNDFESAPLRPVAVPEKAFGLALFLGLFRPQPLAQLAFSAAGSARFAPHFDTSPYSQIIIPDGRAKIKTNEVVRIYIICVNIYI